MANVSLPISQPVQPVVKSNQQQLKIHIAQENLYSFLLEIVRDWPPEEVLHEFKRLFINNMDSVSTDSVQAIYEIVVANDEEVFRHTLKRSCYILINNWENNRKFKYIHHLVELFAGCSHSKHRTVSRTMNRLRRWIENFTNSTDYEELKLFIAKHEEEENKGGHWVNRYTSYLLVAQYVDLNNPVEQREAAIQRAKQLKDKFKFDLAMYIARSQSNNSNPTRFKNPTILGDEVLRLIKSIVIKRGGFSYENIANIFLKQTQNQKYSEFKQSIQKYLIYSVNNPEFVETLKRQVAEKLTSLYENYDLAPINDALLLRTCNRLIDYLTTENRSEPSTLFALLLSQENPLTLVIVLLKIILISKNSRSHLEARIGELIRYYERFPDEDCAWMINFLEIFNITFAIYAENIEYNLIKMNANGSPYYRMMNLDEYRVFSQTRGQINSEDEQPLLAENI
jgi:hypothetical protein